MYFVLSLLSLDALPAAVQPTGKATAAEMVHDVHRQRKEEGDSGHDDAGTGPTSTFLQLPPVEGSEDCLQKVHTEINQQKPPSALL